MPLYDSVVAILADGSRPDVMRRLADAGEMPALRRHFVDAGGFVQATSVFPTVSGPAHLPVLTGVHPGGANLPGIRWAERPRGRRGRFLGRTRSYMAPLRAWKLERDVPPHVRTMFSYVPRTADVNTWFVRGCPAAARRTRYTKAAAFIRSLLTKDWYRSDLQAESALVAALEQGYTSAFAVFPAIDELGHRFGPLCDESTEAYRRFDACLGRVMDALARVGRAHRTLVLVTSDHGQTATHTHIDVDDLVARVYPKTLSYPKIWRHLFGADAAVMVSGNAMANIYVTGPDGWHQRPDFGDERSRAGELCASLLAHEAVDHVIYREPEPDTYVVRGRAGKTTIAVDRVTDADEPRLTVTVQGEDLLGCGALAGPVTRDQIAAATAASPYPDAPWQIAEFFRSSRAGDLIVCARAGYDLRSRFEYQPHRGSHGGLESAHMLVPAALNARWQAPRPVRSVDLLPTMLAALGLPEPEGLDGRAVPIARP